MSKSGIVLTHNMNILVLSDGFPPISSGGAENIAYSIATKYVELGNNVTVVTIDHDLKNGEIIEKRLFGMQLFLVGSSYNTSLASYVCLYNAYVLKSIKSILNNYSFNMAHIHNIHYHISYSVIRMLNKKRIKVIMTMHDYMSIDYGKFIQGINHDDLTEQPFVCNTINPFKTLLAYGRKYNPFRNIVIRYMLKKANKLITVSKSQENILNENGIKNTITINNGILKIPPISAKSEIVCFRKKYNIKEDDKVLLWAGRLSAEKGSMQVFKLMKKMIEKKPKVKLLVAGNYMFNGNDSDIENHIISTGWLNMTDMQLAYVVTDITLEPSIYPDPFPTVVLESMREGTPVVATCFGGAKVAVIDGKTGYIVNPFNINVFYEKVCMLLDDKRLYNLMKRNSLEVFNKEFTIEASTNKYLNLINSL